MDDPAEPSDVVRGIDPDLLARAAALAASRGSTLTDVLTTILAEYVTPTSSSSPMSEPPPSIEHTFE